MDSTRRQVRDEEWAGAVPLGSASAKARHGVWEPANVEPCDGACVMMASPCSEREMDMEMSERHGGEVVVLRRLFPTNAAEDAADPGPEQEAATAAGGRCECAAQMVVERTRSRLDYCRCMVGRRATTARPH
jgi:hypothetical protein